MDGEITGRRRPYIFRDPVHGDIAFARDGSHDLVRRIVDASGYGVNLLSQVRRLKMLQAQAPRLSEMIGQAKHLRRRVLSGPAL